MQEEKENTRQCVITVKVTYGGSSSLVKPEEQSNEAAASVESSLDSYGFFWMVYNHDVNVFLENYLSCFKESKKFCKIRHLKGFKRVS